MSSYRSDMKVAITGKGGVGKSFIAGCLAHSFARKGWKTIAIDADPSPNLALTLGLSAEEARTITPLCDNKDLVQKKTDSGFTGVFRLSFTVDDIIESYSVKTPAGAYLLVMGTVRGMGTGCTCPANTLVRNLLRSLFLKEHQAVIVDMEAGVEHLGRGTAEHVDIMLITTDASLKALETARTIYRIASAAGIACIRLLGNRTHDAGEEERIKNYANQYALPIIGMIPFDSQVVEADIIGDPPIFLAESVAVRLVENLADRISEGGI
jgi:CO dehydrogenase maturation factor